MKVTLYNCYFLHFPLFYPHSHKYSWQNFVVKMITIKNTAISSLLSDCIIVNATHFMAISFMISRRYHEDLYLSAFIPYRRVMVPKFSSFASLSFSQCLRPHSSVVQRPFRSVASSYHPFAADMSVHLSLLQLVMRHASEAHVFSYHPHSLGLIYV